MTTYSIEITDESADCLVRDVIRSSIETLFEMATEEALDDAKLLIEAHNFYGCPDEWLSFEDLRRSYEGY